MSIFTSSSTIQESLNYRYIRKVKLFTTLDLIRFPKKRLFKITDGKKQQGFKQKLSPQCFSSQNISTKKLLNCKFKNKPTFNL